MWRLPAFWFLYMAGLGLVYPFQVVWFEQSAGVTGQQLGLILALRPLMGIIGQPTFGRIADRTGQRGRVLGAVMLCAALFYALLPWMDGVVAIGIVFAAAAFFGTSVMSLGTSVSMAALGPESSARFGRVRAWGTVGYAILLVAFPRLLERWREANGLQDAPGEPGLGVLFIGMAGLCAVAGVVIFSVPLRGAGQARSKGGDLRLLVGHRPFRRLLVLAFLAHALLQGPIQFLPLLVSDRGGDLTDVANLWLPMLVVETVLVYFSSQAAVRFGPKALILVGIGADGLRWILTLLAPSFAWMWPAQMLHGVVIAGFLIGGAVYVEQVVPERLRSTGQAGLAVVGISFATAVSAISTGTLMDLGTVETPFWVGGIGSVGLAVSAIWWLPKPQKMAEPPHGTEISDRI